MSYRIIPAKIFENDFKKLDKNFQVQIKRKFEKVAENPERHKHLRFDLKGSCRIRIDKFRVVFSYDVQRQELYLEKIAFGHKY